MSDSGTGAGVRREGGGKIRVKLETGVTLPPSSSSSAAPAAAAAASSYAAGSASRASSAASSGSPQLSIWHPRPAPSVGHEPPAKRAAIRRPVLPSLLSGAALEAAHHAVVDSVAADAVEQRVQAPPYGSVSASQARANHPMAHVLPDFSSARSLPPPRPLSLTARRQLLRSFRPSASNLFASVQLRERGLFSSSSLQARVVDDRLRSLSLSTTEEIFSPHAHPIVDLDCDRTENRYLLSAGGDGLVALFDVARKCGQLGYKARAMHPNKGRGHRSGVNSIFWYPFDTGMFLSGGVDGRLCVWDTNRFGVEQSFVAHTKYPVNAVRMSSVATTHALIATATAHANVRLCDLNSGGFTHTLMGHSSEVLTLDWSPTDEFQLATGSVDQTIRVWDIRRPGALMCLDQYNQLSPFINQRYVDVADANTKRDVNAHDGSVQHLVWFDSGAHLLSQGTDRKVKLWETRTGRNTLLNYEHLSAASPRQSRFRVSSSSRHLFIPQGVHLHQYDVWSGHLLKKHAGHFERIHCCAMNHATQQVYSAGADKRILVWSPKAHGATNPQAEAELAEAERKEREEEEVVQQGLDRDAHLDVMQPQALRASGPLRPTATPGYALSRILDPDRDAWSDEEEP